MKVVSLPLEFSRGVDLIGHDPGDGFLNIFHPFCHFSVSHVVDLLDEGVILLPKRHLGSLFISRTWKIEGIIYHCNRLLSCIIIKESTIGKQYFAQAWLAEAESFAPCCEILQLSLFASIYGIQNFWAIPIPSFEVQLLIRIKWNIFPFKVNQSALQLQIQISISRMQFLLKSALI